MDCKSSTFKFHKEQNACGNVSKQKKTKKKKKKNLQLQ